MTLAGDWGFTKDRLGGAPFHLVLSGRAYVDVEGDKGRWLEAGDIVILPHGSCHRLLAQPEAVSVPWKRIMSEMGWQHWKPGMRCKTVDLRYGAGRPVTRLISGVFAFGDQRRNPLLEALPVILALKAGERTPASAAIASIAPLLESELLSGLPGAESIAARLADILFIQVVRHYLSSAEIPPRGWLRGIADRELAAAILIMHSTPEKPWSVATMARELGMSRSRFAARFQETVGQGPLEYLTNWRMYRAAGRLTGGRVPLSVLAAEGGYRSDVAFSKAFKRWAGTSPLEYRRRLEQGAPAENARPHDAAQMTLLVRDGDAASSSAPAIEPRVRSARR